jgi:CheY-like chemotaxis protein
VLLVEDDVIDAMNVQRAFAAACFRGQMFRAGDGLEALEMLRSAAVPREGILILLDLSMPRMNGLELLAELRAEAALAHLPVVVLTTSNEERDRVNAYAHHVAGYMVKPVTYEKFVDVVETLHDYWDTVELP